MINKPSATANQIVWQQMDMMQFNSGSLRCSILVREAKMNQNILQEAAT